MPKPDGPQFNNDQLEEQLLRYSDDDSGYFGTPVKGELPEPGTTIYHGIEPPELGLLPKSTGIHWTTRPRVAADFASQTMTPVISAVVENPEDQIIPRLSLQHSDARNDEGADIVRDREQEYHVRPGSLLRVTNRDELRRIGLDVPEMLGIEHPESHPIQYLNLKQFTKFSGPTDK